MRRRQLQQLKKESSEEAKMTVDPSVHVPAEVMEQARKIREALTSGKAICDDCLRVFSGKMGLKVHKGHGCKGKDG